ncbi:DUF4070 domain-containing protein, partial [Calditrichota bacterium]
MMQDVDFRFVFIGIESPDEEVLKSVNKKVNLNINIAKAINKIYSYGIIVNAGLIMGFDNENEQTAENMITCIQESGICMAMLGMLYALPNTQLTKRLEKEGRLFEDGSTLRIINPEIDQMTSGLNFIASRPRLNVLKDFVHVTKYIYDPKHYYERMTYTILRIKPVNKYRPGIGKMLKMVVI